jgi:hypothetical protein
MPGNKYCVNFVNLFEAQGFQLDDREIDELLDLNSFNKVLNFIESASAIPNYLEEQKYGHTFYWRNPGSGRKELFALSCAPYEEELSETDPFALEENDSSVFGLGILGLKPTGFANPWCVIEGISAKAKSLSVFIYHATSLSRPPFELELGIAMQEEITVSAEQYPDDWFAPEDKNFERVYADFHEGLKADADTAGLI